MTCFNDQKRDTKNNQCNGNGGIVVKQCFKLLIKQQPDNCRRHTGNQNLQPQHDNIHAQIRNQPCPNSSGVIGRFLERKNGIPEYDHNCQNGAKLDHNLKHTVEFFRYLQRHKFIEQNHMPRTANGQPFRDAFDDTEKRCFQ